MLEIPLQPVPVQELKTVVAGQNVQIYLRAKPQGVFADLTVNGAPVVTGSLALDGVPLVPPGRYGLAGNFVFLDTQGADDPEYSGLGSRFVLAYLTAGEYDQLQ